MRSVKGIALILAAATLAVACSRSPQADSTASVTATPPDSADSTATSVGDASPPAPISEGQAGRPTTPKGAPSPSSAETIAPTSRPSEPILDGVKPAPPEQDGAGDVFDRRAHLPYNSTRVVAGRNQHAEWRLYAYRDEGRACVHFASQSATNGGADGTCEQKPPLGRSVSESDHGRFIYGLTASNVTKVRIEHSDALAETFDTVTATDYSERFYAGQISLAPISRIVALDANGNVVTQQTDVASLNA